MAPVTVHRVYTKHELYDAMPEFIERHWPKNDTAATGGPATPGRGEAMAAIAMFIAELEGQPRATDAAYTCRQPDTYIPVRDL